MTTCSLALGKDVPEKLIMDHMGFLAKTLAPDWLSTSFLDLVGFFVLCAAATSSCRFFGVQLFKLDCLYQKYLEIKYYSCKANS